MSAEVIAVLTLGSMVFSVLVGRRWRNLTFFSSPLRGSLIHPGSSDIDVLRVGSAALITLGGELHADDAHAVARRCEEMIADGVAHLVVELGEVSKLSAPTLQLLLYLVELERMRGGRVCAVYKDRRVLERLEIAGVTEHLSFMTSDRGEVMSTTEHRR